MFNLKDKSRLDQVQIIGDNSPSKVSNSDCSGWRSGFEALAQRQGSVENQKKPSTGNRFRVRIYNVY